MNNGLNLNANIVFSTDKGELCPKCAKPIARCTCKQQSKAIIKGDGIVRISRQTKGRKGKGVTIITGIPLAAAELKELATKLKNKCGCGGTIKDGTIEIQGDQRNKLFDELTKLGHKPKLAGG